MKKFLLILGSWTMMLMGIGTVTFTSCGDDDIDVDIDRSMDGNNGDNGGNSDNGGNGDNGDNTLIRQQIAIVESLKDITEATIIGDDIYCPLILMNTNLGMGVYHFKGEKLQYANSFHFFETEEGAKQITEEINDPNCTCEGNYLIAMSSLEELQEDGYPINLDKKNFAQYLNEEIKQGQDLINNMY